MLIKTGYPNPLHGCDFLCFNLMTELLMSLRSLKGWFSLAHKHNISISKWEHPRHSISRNIRRTNPLICLLLFSLAHKHKHKKNKHVRFFYAYAYVAGVLTCLCLCYAYALVRTSQNHLLEVSKLYLTWNIPKFTFSLVQLKTTIVTF